MWEVILLLVGAGYGSEQVQVINGVQQIVTVDDVNTGKFHPIKPENTEYMTWQNRRLHTMDLMSYNDETDKNMGQDRWYTMKFYPKYPKGDEHSTIIFNWQPVKRTAFTYMYFENYPLGPEFVEYKITTNFFELPDNVTKPLSSSVDFTKYTFHFNRTHLMLWWNEQMAVKLFLRDLPKDLGYTKSFLIENLPPKSMYKIYYYDPTVFCWTGCYDDHLPRKFHFDKEKWAAGEYTADVIGAECDIVNCTAKMSHSEYPRCVRLHHTPLGEKKQKTLLQCAHENYTYHACEEFPNNPCWYEACDNYDLCNAAKSLAFTLFNTLFFVFSFLMT